MVREIGKGSIVRIRRRSSYWYNDTGTVVTVDSENLPYPVLVRFSKLNYAGINVNFFGFGELELVEDKREKRQNTVGKDADE